MVSDAHDGFPTVSVAYDVGAGWVVASVTHAGDHQAAHLPAIADVDSVDLRIVAADNYGNVLVHELRPAYVLRRPDLYLPLVLR